MRVFVLLVMLLLLPGIIDAPSAQGVSQTWGVGFASCGAWSQSGNASETRRAYFSWIEGFESAISFLTPDTMRAVDTDAMVAWLDQYCGRFPLEPLSHAAVALSLDLKK